MGDRIVVMKDGIVQQVESPLKIYNAPINQFVAGFIGSPTMNFFTGKIVLKDQLFFIRDQGEFTLPLPETDKSRLANYRDQTVVLGIRPEHIHSRPTNQSSAPVSVKIEVIEPVGNEIFLYFVVGAVSGQYVSRIPSDIVPQSGKEFVLYFDTSKLHFFHPVSGEAL